MNAQGEDVVSGVRTPLDISEMKELMPDAHEQLMEILRTLESHYKDMQDTEFTVEEGTLYMLQTRDAKRPAQAAVRFAFDAVEEGLLDKVEAMLTIDAERLDALLHPAFARDADFEVLTKGVAASPGAATGAIVFTADDAVAAGRDDRDVIWCGPSPRRTTWRASTRPRASSRARAARRATPRSSRAGWASPAWRERASSRSTCTRRRCGLATRSCRRATRSRSMAAPAWSRRTKCRSRRLR